MAYELTERDPGEEEEDMDDGDANEIAIRAQERRDSGVEDMPLAAVLVHRSAMVQPTTMYVNVYNQHLSYITDIKIYSKTWRCSRCAMLFDHRSHHQRHEIVCSASVKHVFPYAGFGKKH